MKETGGHKSIWVSSPFGTYWEALCGENEKMMVTIFGSGSGDFFRDWR